MASIVTPHLGDQRSRPNTMMHSICVHRLVVVKRIGAVLHGKGALGDGINLVSNSNHVATEAMVSLQRVGDNGER